MRDEIAAAVVFVSRLVKEDNDGIDKDRLSKFSDSLSTVLRERFKNHWYEDAPHKGQGYRCIRLNGGADPVIEKAAENCGLKFLDLKLPDEMTLWVDPTEVTCRFGESQGSLYFTVATFKKGKVHNQAHTLDISKVLNDHNHKRNAAFSQFVQNTTSRSNVNANQKDDAGVGSGSGSKPPFFSPCKPHRPHGSPVNNGFHPPPHCYNGFYPLPPPHRRSPPMDFHRWSPSFPGAHIPSNRNFQGQKRNWVRGPDLVKA